MTVSFDVASFVDRWLAKAETYKTDSAEGCFDKFFTLFVAYNRLYTEATFSLESGGQLDLSTRRQFPDREAATDYVLQYVGASQLLHALGDDESQEALKTIVDHLCGSHFHIRLHPVTGRPQRSEDLKLLKKLRATNRQERAKAILNVLYSIRCNMFHGRKGFALVQMEILKPTIVILNKTVHVLYEKLKSEGTQQVNSI